MRSVREIALRILLELDAGSERARNILDKTIRDLGLVNPDKSFLTELVYGTIRWRGRLDWIIRHLVRSKRIQPEIVEILRLGLYQLLFLSGVPDHAAVNESVELAKKYGHKGASRLVNAVLRRASTFPEGNFGIPDINADPVRHIAVRYSHPEFMVKRWIERYGIDETVRLCSANNLRAPLYIRTNALKASRDRLIQSLEEEGVTAAASRNLPESIEITSLPLSISELSSYKQGMFTVQDEGATLISHILDPQAGETIIDACAAPGGKATHIAELMQNRGRVLAFDINAHRLPMVAESCRRLGITIVETIEADARKLDKYISEKADRVLVDVPCTGLGVLRRRVEARWRRTPDQFETLPELQYAILSGAAQCVKTGGVLLYCTCTIEPEENQQVVARFLNTHPQFQIHNVLPEELKQVKNLVSAEGYVQTYPHLHNIDGFFAVRMQ